MQTADRRPRIGIIGYGFIGQTLVERIQAAGSGLDLAFVYNRSPDKLKHIDPALIATELGAVNEFEADLIVETAHPGITAEYGVSFMTGSNYMPLSTTALVDDNLRLELIKTGEANGTRLYLAAGALVGGSALMMRREQWRECAVMSLYFKSIATTF